MTRLSRRIDEALDNVVVCLARFLRLLTHRLRTVDYRMLAKVSAVRAEMSWPYVLTYARRYGYRSRHHLRPFSHRNQVSAETLTLELWWDRVRRTHSPLSKAHYQRRSNSYVWDPWREAQEAVFLRVEDILC